MPDTPVYAIPLPEPGGNDDAWAPILNDGIVALEGEVRRVEIAGEEHAARQDNPHNVTPEQVGAMGQAEADLRYVAKAGDTMGGPLFLADAPTASMHAATKLYVDQQIISVGDARFVNTAGDTMTGLLTLSGPPTSNLHAATKLYVDQQVATGLTPAAGDARYVNVAGDTMTGVLTLPAGTAAAPALMMGDTDSGLIGGADSVAVTVGGTLRLTVAAAALTVSPPIRASNGTAAAPGYGFTNDTNMGMYRGGTQILGFSTNSVTRLSITTTDITSTLPVTLPGDPTLPLHAATRGWVLANASGLTQAAADLRYLQLTGGTLTGPLTLSGAPTLDPHAATKLYVDTKAGAYLPLAGGTLTGLLTLSGAPTANLHAATKAFVDAHTTRTDNPHATTAAQIGALTPATAASTYLPLAGGSLTGAVNTNSGIALRGVNSSGGGYNYSPLLIFNSNWEDCYFRQSHQVGVAAQVELVVGSTTPKVWSFNNSGNTYMPGALALAGGFNAPAATISGAINSGTLGTSGGVIVGGSIAIGGNPDFYLSLSGAARTLNFEPNTFIQKEQATANLSFMAGNSGDLIGRVGPSNHYWQLRQDGAFIISGVGFRPGGGAWADSSDIRIKDIEGDYMPGLDAICALRPKRYRFKAETGRDTAIEYVGPIAQEALVAMPDTVTVGPQRMGEIELEDMHSYSASNVLWALVNGMRELRDQNDALHARIKTLEGAS